MSLPCSLTNALYLAQAWGVSQKDGCSFTSSLVILPDQDFYSTLMSQHSMFPISLKLILSIKQLHNKPVFAKTNVASFLPRRASSDYIKLSLVLDWAFMHLIDCGAAAYILLHKQLTLKGMQMKIVFVESPINQISNENIATCEQTSAAGSNPTDKFTMISKRLCENIKKLESTELKNANLKRFSNFKFIKNSIISGEASAKRSHVASNLTAHGKELSSPEERRVAQVNQVAASIYLGGNQTRKRLFQLQAKNQPQNEQNPVNLTGGIGPLASCLKQIKEVKKTIKNLKERCQNGLIEHPREQRAQAYYNTSSAKKKYLSSSRQKYLSNSGEKYSYTNYHDLSQRKLSELSQRKRRNQKSFNWIRNLVPVKEFTICTAEGPLQQQIQ